MSKRLSHMSPVRSACFSAVAVCFLLFAGCPGELPGSKYDGGGGGSKDTTLPGDGPGSGTEQGGQLDKGPPTEQGTNPLDSGKPVDTGKPPDSKPAPDLKPPPDTKPPTPDKGGGTTGAKCPPACATGYLCVNNKCRKKCTDGTDVCKAITVCSTSEVCMPVTAKESVCTAATAPGGSCKNTHCGSKHVCASISGKPYICLPVCNKKGASCGTGGTCAQDQKSKCLFCTKN